MKSSEIRELATKEIEERIDTEQNMLVRMKMNHAVSPLDNPTKIQQTRRIVARLKTELRSRKTGEQQTESKE
jgi:large subunit ribosomal protein L29